MRAPLAEVIARSATFEERVAAAWLETSPAPEAELSAIGRAVGLPPGALAVRGPVPAILARARWQGGAAAPDWAAALERLLDGAARADARDAAPALDSRRSEDAIDGALDAAAVSVAFAGFTTAAAAWLDGAIAASPVAVWPAARRGLVAWLRRAWASLARLVLRDEVAASGQGASAYAAALAAPGGWPTLVAAYPVLGRLLGAELCAWQRGCARLLAHTADDWAALGQAGAPALADVTALALDRPPDGTPPLAIDLPDGRRVVHHDKDLRMAAWFADVVDAVAREGVGVSMAPRRVLARGDHAWADHVVAAPCADRAEVERYLVRAGVYLRVLQAVRATDQHGRNLIAAGEHPMLIDVETVLQPLRGRRAIDARVDASPLACGLLPTWLVGPPGRRAVNVGGLLHGGALELPIDPPGVVTDVAPTIPAVDGAPTSLAAHLPSLLAGYRAAGAAFATSARVRELLDAAAELRVAVMWRPGILLKQVLAQSLTPLLLTDGRLRDAFLTRLVLGVPDGAARTLAHHELHAIRDAATPRFESSPDRDVVHLPDGTVVAGVWAAPALARLELVRAPADVARDLDAIATATTLGTGSGVATHDDASTISAHRTRIGAPLDHAVAIADEILAEAVADAGELSWLGASWCPLAGVRQLGPLPSDLLSGTAGLAILFAYLHRRTGLSRLRDAAVATLAPIARDLEAAARGSVLPGAFLGAGAALHAVHTCARLLDDAALRAHADRALAAIAAAVSPDAPRDIVVGAAGLLLVAATFDAPPRPALDAIADRLRAPAPPRPPRFLDGTRWLAGLPDEDDGVAWALARWAGSTALPADLAAIAATALAGDPRPSLADLVAVLAARDASTDASTDAAPLTARAHAIAAALAARHAATGRWLDDPDVAERFHLSALSGTAALAIALAGVDAPDLPCCPRLVY